MNKIILILIILLSSVTVCNASNNNSSQTYYCDEIIIKTAYGTTTSCIPINDYTINKNIVMNNISNNYQDMLFDLDTIANYKGSANATQLTFAVKRLAQVNIIVLKFLKIMFWII